MDVNLEKWNDCYSNAEVEVSSDYADIPDGKYDVIVEKVELKSSQKGNDMLSWQLKILAPKMVGRVLFKINMLISEANIKWLKTDLSVCGLNLGKLSDLQSRLEDLLDVKLRITKKTVGDFENIYFNELISGETVKGNSEFENDVPF